jgi:hypothetical protein
MMFTRIPRIFYLPLFLLLISACGGGGGSGGGASGGGGTTSSSPPAPPPPTPPPPPPPATYSIGGSVSGLVGSLTLQNNGADDLTISADGVFTFSLVIDDGSGFAATVMVQPAGQQCSVTGDSGTLSGSDVNSVQVLCGPAPPVLAIAGLQTKMFRFTWPDVAGETEYRLLEDLDGNSGFTQREVLLADSEQADIEVFLPESVDARYLVQSCDSVGCLDSNVVNATDAIDDAVGYIKATDPNAFDSFSGLRGTLALSADGTTLAVGAYLEDSSASGIDGDATDNAAIDSGAAYIFTRVGLGSWVQQGYIKASNAESEDRFGFSVSLSNDGNTLAVSASAENSSSTGINSDELNNSDTASGAAYVFVRDAVGSWSQQAYVKASNTGNIDEFGWSVALSGDGDTLAVGAVTEASAAAGANGDQSDNSLTGAGATYVYVRDATDNWSQQAYLKSSAPDVDDRFGWSVALSEDGNTLVVGASKEGSDADGIDGDDLDDTLVQSGAAYLFSRDSLGAWTQEAYIKASNSGTDDFFTYSLALSDDGSTIAVGGNSEWSNTTGIDGDQANNSAPASGAVYVFVSDGLGGWSQQAYVKASNTGVDDRFGSSIGLSADGSKMAIGARQEGSASIGIGGDQFDDTALDSGAVYLFARDGTGVWQQENYIKSPNSESNDFFGDSVALSDDGLTLAVGARGEDSAAVSGGDQSDNLEDDAGAVYIY